MCNLLLSCSQSFNLLYEVKTLTDSAQFGNFLDLTKQEGHFEGSGTKDKLFNKSIRNLIKVFRNEAVKEICRTYRFDGKEDDGMLKQAEIRCMSY